MKREDIEDKIQDLIDGRLSGEEVEVVRAEIAKDKDLTLYYNTLKEVDLSLQTLDLAHPSEEFTAHVMHALYRSKSRSFDIRSILILIGLIICATAGLIFSSQVNLKLPSISPVSTEVTLLEKVQVNLPQIVLPPSEMMLNALYFGLLFMALIYFDKVILSRFFSRSSEQ